MSVEGFKPLQNGEYEAYRTRQVSLAEINTQESNYQMVGRLDTNTPEAALIDITDIRTFENKSGQVALHAMLLRGADGAGIRPFRGYESPDDRNRATVYPNNPEGLQLFLPEHGRFQLLYGYLIALSGSRSDLFKVDQVDHHPAQLDINDEQFVRLR